MNRRHKKKSVISDVTSSYELNSRFSVLILTTLSIIFLLLSLISPSQLSGIRSFTTALFSPIISIVGRPFQTVSNSIGSVSGVTALRAENAMLKAENIRLKEWYQTALMLQAENQSLHKLLNVKVDTHQNYLTSRVISDTSNSFVKTIIVASGAGDGVKKNQAVLSGEGMIGRVIDTGSQSARVLLLTDINSRLPVLIEGTNQKAILSGKNSDFPVLKHMPKDTGVIAGARVVTSGDGGVFPPNIPVGRLQKSADGQFIVKLFSDTNKISFVRIIDTTAPANLIRSN